MALTKMTARTSKQYNMADKTMMKTCINIE